MTSAFLIWTTGLPTGYSSSLNQEVRSFGPEPKKIFKATQVVYNSWQCNALLASSPPRELEEIQSMHYSKLNMKTNIAGPPIQYHQFQNFQNAQSVSLKHWIIMYSCVWLFNLWREFTSKVPAKSTFSKCYWQIYLDSYNDLEELRMLEIPLSFLKLNLILSLFALTSRFRTLGHNQTWQKFWSQNELNYPTWIQSSYT